MIPNETPNSTPEPKNLTVAEVAKRLAKSEEAVRKLCRDGKLPGARRENNGAPWQIPARAIDDYLHNNPPASVWQRLRVTTLWQRSAAVLAVVLSVLIYVNNITGFFSNLFGAAPAVEIACRQPLIANLCSPTVTPTATVTTTATPIPTPTVTPTPLPIHPAAEGETLIIIATFHGELANRDEPHVMIKEGIEKGISKLQAENRLGNLNLRVAIHPQKLTGGEEMQPTIIGFARPYSATVVIWGDVTGTRVRVNFLNLQRSNFDMSRPASIEEKQRTFVADPQAYNNLINYDLPAQMSFLTLFPIGQFYYINKEYADAAQVIEQAIAVLPEGTKIEGVAEAYFLLGWLYQALPNEPASFIP